MRSVSPADFVRIVAEALEDPHLSVRRREAMLSLATVLGALGSTGDSWSYRVVRRAHYR